MICPIILINFKSVRQCTVQKCIYWGQFSYWQQWAKINLLSFHCHYICKCGSDRFMFPTRHYCSKIFSFDRSAFWKTMRNLDRYSILVHLETEAKVKWHLCNLLYPWFYCRNSSCQAEKIFIKYMVIPTIRQGFNSNILLGYLIVAHAIWYKGFSDGDSRNSSYKTPLVFK